MCALGPPEIWKVGEEGKEGQGSGEGRGAGERVQAASRGGVERGGRRTREAPQQETPFIHPGQHASLCSRPPTQLLETQDT